MLYLGRRNDTGVSILERCPTPEDLEEILYGSPMNPLPTDRDGGAVQGGIALLDMVNSFLSRKEQGEREVEKDYIEHKFS